MKKILITGGAGFIGENLIKELKRADIYEIIVIDNESIGNLAPIESLAKCIKADIRDEAAMRAALHAVDTVIHLAADTQVIHSIANPVENFEVNVAGTFNLLRWSHEAGVSLFINASTAGAIFGEAAAPVTELTPVNPVSPYGASKLATEGYCSAFSAAYGMRTLSLRFSNVYGPGSQHKKSVIAHFFKLVLSNQELIVYGDGTQVRDFLYVGDLVAGIHSAIRKNVAGTYLLGSGRPTTLNQLLDIIRHTVKSQEITVRYEPYRAGEVHTTWCDITKAETELAFNHATSLEEGIAACWEWFQKQRHSREPKELLRVKI